VLRLTARKKAAGPGAGAGRLSPSVTDISQAIAEPLRNSDAVSVQGKTIIPVTRIGYGFGGGGRSHREPHEGAGGGGGMMAMPLGVFEITGEQTRFIPRHENRRIVGAALIGLCLGLLLARRHGAKM